MLKTGLLLGHWHNSGATSEINNQRCDLTGSRLSAATSGCYGPLGRSDFYRTRAIKLINVVSSE